MNIITGAIGAGKTTVLKELNRLGYKTINEPAREIIAEQRAINGEGVYDREPRLFYELMLSRALFEYKQNHSVSDLVIFDRGIPDNIAYAKLFHIDSKAAENAARLYRYNQKVFFLPGWEKIYVTDEDRKMSFSEAKAFGQRVRELYINLSYTVIDVPFSHPEERAQFISNEIKNKDHE